MSVENVDKAIRDLDVGNLSIQDNAPPAAAVSAPAAASGELLSAPAAPLNTAEESAPSSSQGVAETTASLYVGELEPTVSEAVLFELFNDIGQVSSIRVCRDAVTKRSLGYAYVNFANIADGEKALKKLNYHPVEGHPIRIMWSQRDPSLRKNGAGNIFIKNLDPVIDNRDLHDTFSAFGNILSCKVAIDEVTGQSKGFGFVHYESAESAKAAIENIDGMLLNNRTVFVGPHIPKEDRKSKLNEVLNKFTNVYVKNIDTEITEEELREIFGKYGAITSLRLEVEANGKSRGFGFVNFESHDSAVKAIEALHDTELKSKKLYVGRAQKKSERLEELKKQYEAARMEKLNKAQGVNLFIKNLDDSIDDEKLSEEFSQYGTITSVKVMADETGKSKGFGFVAFSSPEEASRAISEENQKMFAGKPLYVALAQRKEVRRSQLEQQIQIRNQLRLQQQQAASGMPASQYMPMFFNQPQMFPPGARAPIGAPAPQGFIMSQAPRPGVPPQGQWAAAGRQMPGQPMYGGVPQYQDMQGRNNGQPPRYYRGPNNRQQRNRDDMPQGPGAPMPQVQQPVLTAQTLAQWPPEQHKRILGETLYQKVVNTGKAAGPEAAGKITGMLLDLSNEEILTLLSDESVFETHFNDALGAYGDFLNKQQSEEAAAAAAAQEEKEVTV